MATTAVFRFDPSEDAGVSTLNPEDVARLQRWSGTRVELAEEVCDDYGIYAIRFEDGTRAGAYQWELSEWVYDEDTEEEDGWSRRLDS